MGSFDPNSIRIRLYAITAIFVITSSWRAYTSTPKINAKHY